MTIIIIKIILFILLLASLGFFNGSETAITSLSGAYLRKIKENKSKYYKAVTFWETHTEEMMTAMIIGMNLSVVGMGVLVSSLAFDITSFYKISGRTLIVAFPIISIILALVFGNIFPKTFARYNAEKVGIIVLPLIVRISKLLKYIIKFLSGISVKVLNLISSKKENPNVEADEIDFLLSNEKTSPLEEEERELVSNIMDFAERKISHVMMPRSEIFAVNIEDKKEDIIKQIIDAEISRIPVYQGNLNNIIGIIYSKDLLVAWKNSDFIIIEDLIRPAYYVPESAKISKMLKEFKTGHHHMAIVVDEFGSTVGIASIEDLLEEIVGEVWDEYDMRDKTVVPYGKGEYLILAYESVLNVNKELDLNIPEDEDFSTINGWVLELFGEIPENGKKIVWQEYEIEIQDADEKQVNRIILRKKENVLSN